MTWLRFQKKKKKKHLLCSTPSSQFSFTSSSSSIIKLSLLWVFAKPILSSIHIEFSFITYRSSYYISIPTNIHQALLSFFIHVVLMYLPLKKQPASLILFLTHWYIFDRSLSTVVLLAWGWAWIGSDQNTRPSTAWFTGDHTDIL